MASYIAVVVNDGVLQYAKKSILTLEKEAIILGCEIRVFEIHGGVG